MKTHLFLLTFMFFAIHLFSQENYTKEIASAMDSSNFDSIAKTLNYKGGDEITVYTKFKVDIYGNTVDIAARSVHPYFEAEAIRVLREVKMDSGMTNGEEKSQLFAMPIIFKIETDSQKKKRLKKEARKKKKAFSKN